MPTPSWTVSFTMPTASNSPAKACAGHEANRTRRLDQPPSPVTQIHRPARLATRAASFRYGGRHHSGIPGDIIPLYPGDFVGIRKHPHYRDNLAGPRRSNQKAGPMKDRVDRLVQGKNQPDAPPAGAAAAAIPASTQRRPRLRQKLPSDILTLQSKGHLNLVATLGLGIDWSANEIIPSRR